MRQRGFDCWTPAGAVREAEDKAAAVIRLIGLAGREHVEASYLSYGQRRLLEIGVALAGEPDLLLMDEPTSGLGGRPMETLRELVQRLSEALTIVVIEHDMNFVLSLSHHISVLHRGAVIAEGPPAAIRDNAEVRECYLGTLKYTAAGVMATERPLLVVEGIDTFYGDAQALNGLSLTVGPARRSACWAGTARGRPPPSRASWAWSRRGEAASPSTAPTSRGCRPTGSPAGGSPGCRTTGGSFRR